MRRCGAIEAGTVDGADPTLRERVASLKNVRDKSIEALDYAKRSSAVPIEIDPVVIERFTRLMRERLVSGTQGVSQRDNRSHCRLGEHDPDYRLKRESKVHARAERTTDPCGS
jgi:hypothetical protein